MESIYSSVLNLSLYLPLIYRHLYNRMNEWFQFEKRIWFCFNYVLPIDSSASIVAGCESDEKKGDTVWSFSMGFNDVSCVLLLRFPNRIVKLKPIINFRLVAFWWLKRWIFCLFFFFFALQFLVASIITQSKVVLICHWKGNLNVGYGRKWALERESELARDRKCECESINGISDNEANGNESM